MSESAFKQLERSGRIGPKPIRFGAKLVRWRRDELVQWIEAGCPSRELWVEQAAERSAQGPRLADTG